MLYYYRKLDFQKTYEKLFHLLCGLIWKHLLNTQQGSATAKYNEEVIASIKPVTAVFPRPMLEKVAHTNQSLAQKITPCGFPYQGVHYAHV